MTQGESEPMPGTVFPSTGRTLFAVVGGATAWAVHFLGSYALVAIGCAAGWGGMHGMIAALTVAFAGLALWSTVVAWRGWRGASGDQPLDLALSEPRGWFAFLMLTGVLLGAVSVLAIALEGLGSMVLPACGWDVR
jgi:hypothetical protein